MKIYPTRFSRWVRLWDLYMQSLPRQKQMLGFCSLPLFVMVRFFFSQANLFVLNFPPHFMVLHIYSQDISVICEFLQRGDDKSLKNSKIATKKVARNAQEELTE